MSLIPFSNGTLVIKMRIYDRLTRRRERLVEKKKKKKKEDSKRLLYFTRFLFNLVLLKSESEFFSLITNRSSSTFEYPNFIEVS